MGVARTQAMRGLAAPTRMMSVVPTVYMGGSVLRSLEMLNLEPKCRKKSRR